MAGSGGVMLNVVPPPKKRISILEPSSGEVSIRFAQDPAHYELLAASSLPVATNSWQMLTNVAAQPRATNVVVADTTTAGSRFYQLGFASASRARQRCGRSGIALEPRGVVVHTRARP